MISIKKISLSENYFKYLFVIVVSFLIGFVTNASPSLISCFIITFALLPFVVKRPFAVIWFIFFLSIFLPYLMFYLRIYLPIGMIFVSILSGFYIIYMGNMFTSTKAVSRVRVVDLLNIALICWGVVSFLFSSEKGIAFIGLKENFKMCFLFLFIRAIKPPIIQLKKFALVFLIVGVVVALYGIYQYFFDYYSLINKFGGVMNQVGVYFGLSDLKGHLGAKRAYSLFLNNFVLAYYLMIAFIMLMVKFLLKVNKNKRVFLFFALFLIIFCFVLTFTRSAWVGGLLGLLIILIVLRKSISMSRVTMILLTLLSIVSVTIVFLPNVFKDLLFARFTSIFSTDPGQSSLHYQYLQDNLALMLKAPLGIGLGKTSAYLGSVWTESSIFKIIIELGIIPGILYFSIFMSGILKGVKLFKKTTDKDQKEVVLIGIGVTTSYLVSGIVFPVWFSWFPAMVAWIYLAMLFNLMEQNENRPFNYNRQL